MDNSAMVWMNQGLERDSYETTQDVKLVTDIDIFLGCSPGEFPRKRLFLFKIHFTPILAKKKR